MSQDWTNVVIGNALKEKAKPGFSVNPLSHTVRTLDAATDVGKLKELSPESRQAMIAARAANKWTQVELNQRCAFPAHTIRDMEAGRFTPNQKQISILQRILKVQLKLC